VNRTLRRLWPDVGLLCVSVVTAWAVARLFQGGSAGRALAPLLVAAVVGCALPSLLALLSVPLPIRAVAGTVAVILTSLWTSFGNATSFGAPTAHTWHVVTSQLRATRPIVSEFAVPLRPTPGLVFLAALGCGVVAMLASVLLRAGDFEGHGELRLYPGVALLSPLGLLAFACSQSTPSSMVLPVILFVAAAALTLTASRAVRTEPIASVRSPSWRGRPRRWVAPAAVTVGAMAAVALVATAVSSSSAGAGSSGPGVAPAVPLTAESLTSNLLAVEVHDANVVLFHASSRIRTYWQVAVLDDLRNGVWVPDAATQRAVQRSGRGASFPPSGPNTTATALQLVRSDVTIAALSSRLLPVPPGTIALSGSDATLTGVGAVSTSVTAPGEQYSTVSDPPASESQDFGDMPISADPPALVQTNTALPPMSPSIGMLARSITNSADGSLAEAEELVNWFRSGRFRYTLDPPATTPGTDPLVSFLTQTRSGTCEQFAGAFVVLARSLGLPSRVVVGFTAGRYSGPGQVTVTGADAHAWPQVYLGQHAGWVSFEPTPQQPRGELAPEGVVGPGGVTQPTTPVVPTTAPARTIFPSVPSTVITRTPNPNPLSPVPSSPPHSGLGVLWWTLLSLSAGLVVVLMAIWWRRRRRWSPRGRTPEGLALLARDEVERTLRRAQVDHPPWQPLDLFFEDLRHSGSRTAPRPAVAPPESRTNDRPDPLVTDGMTVARIADEALFGPAPISAERGVAAYEAALRAQRELGKVRRPRPVESASTSSQ
jgi:transglutaminase-like putative cysteine protease